jgi:hypothetical protein
MGGRGGGGEGVVSRGVLLGARFVVARVGVGVGVSVEVGVGGSGGGSQDGGGWGSGSNLSG